MRREIPLRGEKSWGRDTEANGQRDRDRQRETL